MAHFSTIDAALCHDTWAEGAALAEADNATKLTRALEALRETLRVIEAIDYVADQLIKQSIEDAAIGELIRACVLRLRSAAEPFVETIEQAGLV